MAEEQNEGCPACGEYPLVVGNQLGTLDFYCCACYTPLSPTAEMLIKMLPETE